MIWIHLPIELLREAKVNGFSDEQISRILEHGDEEDVYEKRKAAGITRVYKMVDTCSAEFEAKTPYFYSTFEEGHMIMKVRFQIKRKSSFLVQVPTGSARELNLIIAVCMVCLP